MSDWLSNIPQTVTLETLASVARALVLLVFGWVASRLASRALRRVLEKTLEPQQVSLLRRGVSSLILVLFATAALNELGFNLGVLLGAAGILSVALGFASQTSASNIISGLFLLAERPFGVGDVVRIGSTTGEVLSIDLLSVKLRTYDNLFVRIPNESLVKSEVTTLTRFPIRRFDLPVGVAYKEDLARVRRLLLEVAEANPLSLEEPKPVIFLQGFGSSSVDLQFSVWATRESYLELKNTLFEEIKAAFDREGIEIPFPHLSLYAGSASGPLPLRLLGEAAAPAPPAPPGEKVTGEAS